jgi:hypothetical protein
MPWVGFEPMIPVFEREKTFHDLDRAATAIGAGNGTCGKKEIIHKRPQLNSIL